jgi:hypothetical protein
VDGTTVQLPDTPDNQAAYPQAPTQKPGLGFPLCRLVGIVCLGSGALLNASTGRYQGKGSDEQSLLRSILDTLQRGDVLLGDAFYATYFLLCALRERGIDARVGVPEKIHPPRADRIEVAPAVEIIEPASGPARHGDERQGFVMLHLGARMPDSAQAAC